MGQGKSDAPVYGYGHMCTVAERWKGRGRDVGKYRRESDIGN